MIVIKSNGFEYNIYPDETIVMTPEGHTTLPYLAEITSILNGRFEVLRMTYTGEMNRCPAGEHGLREGIYQLQVDYNYAVESDHRHFPSISQSNTFVMLEIGAAFCINRQQYETSSHRVMEEAHDIVHDFLERLHDHLL